MREAYLLRLVDDPLVPPYGEAILPPDSARSHQVTPNPHQVAAVAPLVRNTSLLRKMGNKSELSKKFFNTVLLDALLHRLISLIALPSAMCR
jgi:hypothetical protein